MLLHEVRAWFIKQDAAFYQSAFVSWKEGWTKCVQRSYVARKFKFPQNYESKIKSLPFLEVERLLIMCWTDAAGPHVPLPEIPGSLAHLTGRHGSETYGAWKLEVWEILPLFWSILWSDLRIRAIFLGCRVLQTFIDEVIYGIEDLFR
ncbi:hypothetical protein LAZ67_11002332 [Cordylochernes scorpioides]|uniref:Uncharacterized protein n=1 Tax=Cordylochernes scorpioides TaxID=51811 RepID=A0ABY6L332_9ARAC|nr:hypothetical protein LAZ67_11002332 [Cordylochernes scorpioides]